MPAPPASAATAGVETRTLGSHHGREAAGLPGGVELAGLEPATSWVRFKRKPLRRFAVGWRFAQPCLF